MILFGFRGMRKPLGTTFMLCQRCQRPCAHAIVRHQRWFTLFFIPIFPFKVTYFTSCAMCGSAFKIDRDKAEQLAAAGRDQDAQRVEMTPDGPLSPPPAVTSELAGESSESPPSS
jgi:hypothetical protein